MTAEVCVLNKLAVAMAADSAVTLGGRGDKIYASVDKMFHLASNAPVGVMVYGGASFLGYDWEIIVKQFRKELGNETCDSLHGYAQRFLMYLGNRELFSEELENEFITNLIETELHELKEEIRLTLNKVAKEQNGLDSEEIPPLIEEQVDKMLQITLQHDLITDFDDDFVKKVNEKYEEVISNFINQEFEEIELGETCRSKMGKLILEILTRDWLETCQSGVVFCGFGEKEYMPSLEAYLIEGSLLGKLRIKVETTEAITHQNSASVVPFAQQEMVHTFMQGINPAILKFLKSSTRESVTGALESIADVANAHDPKFASKLNPILATAGEKLLEQLFDEWEDKQRDIWHPVVDIVKSLPKDELASMAEALVNLTKFRRRISTDRETVGGPIDVAVITKGDGFVWVKRKHYFRPELNPRAMTRYTQE